MEYTIVRQSACTLIGISVRTTNEKQQAVQDISALWKQFEEKNLYEKITGKISDSVYSLYTEYESDFTKPYTYMIGCKVKPNTPVPEGLEKKEIAGGTFARFQVEGKMPDALQAAWNEIWQMPLPRAYSNDYEVYHTETYEDPEKSRIDVYIAIQESFAR